LKSLKNLTDNELIGRLQKLVKQEHDLTLEILPHIAEVDRRELYLLYGYGSLSEYCVSFLGYGESSAWRRVAAARVIKNYPEVYDLLRGRKLTFSAVILLSKVIKSENKDELLRRIKNKSQRRIRQIIADYRGPVVIPDQARPTIVARKVVLDHPQLQLASDRQSLSSGSGGLTLAKVGEIPLRSEGGNDPVSETKEQVVLERMYDVRFAGDEEFMQLMDWLDVHLAGRFPRGASYLEKLKYALNYIKEREDLTKKAVRRNSDNSRRASTIDTPQSRHIPASEKEKVWIKSEGKCEYTAPDGKRCNSTHNLQYDHYPTPFAMGGPSTADNLRLLCAKHNQFTAIQVYGKQHMNRYTCKQE
jgi:hypothetical protein